ncbi:unnamed protein product [Staurois parvus]|uniref:Uncharacterized protein n=1 Tax=Staurois parvus TaxID=386267 RepID=A0ABN9E6I7_9NEOB|nr:unnamed protein product [Staurois parvus]
MVGMDLTQAEARLRPPSNPSCGNGCRQWTGRWDGWMTARSERGQTSRVGNSGGRCGTKQQTKSSQVTRRVR